MARTIIICIRCPRGCTVTLTHEDRHILSITGHGCARGEEYARNEYTAPMRTFTSTVRVRGGTLPLCPVKSALEIPKGKMLALARQTCRIEVDAPVRTGDVILRDICCTGVDLVATGNIDRAEEAAP